MFSERLGIHLHGLDLVRDESDGRFYLFDCNYFSSYNDSFKDVSG